MLETGLSENFKVGHHFIVEVGGLFCHHLRQKSERQSQPWAIFDNLEEDTLFITSAFKPGFTDYLGQRP